MPKLMMHKLLALWEAVVSMHCHHAKLSRSYYR